MLDYLSRQPYWMRLVIVSLFAGVICLCASLLPNPWGYVWFAASTLAVIAIVWFDAKLRYSRRAGLLISLWATVRVFAGITILIPTDEVPIYLRIGDDVPYLFDLVIGLLIGLCLILDFRVRSAPKFARTWFSEVFGFSRVNTVGNHNQTIIVQGKNNTVQTGSAETGFNAAIDNAASFLSEKQPDTTIGLLKQLERNSWDKLSGRERYRLKANLGHAFNHKEEWSVAAGLFIEAESYQPDDLNAQALAAAARWMLGQNEVALESANRILTQSPANEIAMATRVHCQPDDLAIEEIEKSIPKELQASVDVLFALYQRARRQRDLTASLRLARRLNELKPIDTQFRIGLGDVLATYALDLLLGRITSDETDAQSIAFEAIEVLDTQLSDGVIGKVSQSQARFARALAHEVVGELEKSESDFRAALEITPNDDELRYQFCIFLVRRDRDPAALKEFEKIPSERLTLDRAILYGGLLQGSKNPADRSKGVELLAKLLADGQSPPPSLAFEAVDALSRARAANGDRDGAAAVVSDFEHSLTTASHRVIEARLALLADDKVVARTKAMEANRCLGDDDQSFLLYYLAQVFVRLEMHVEATEVFKKANALTPFFEVARTVIHSAWQAREIGFLIAYCESYRKSGRFNYSVLESEIACHERLNEHDKALTLIDAFIDDRSRESDEDERFRRYLRLKRSMIGWIVHRPDLVETEANNLPSLSDVEGPDRSIDPVIGASQVLAAGDTPEEGWRLAYEIVRRHFGSHKAHGNLLYIAGPSSKVVFPEQLRVDTQSAVAYQESEGSTQKWIVIEESSNLDSTRHEISHDSPLARELIGKAVGEQFHLRRNSIQDRTAVVSAIMHKVQYRVMDALQNWEQSFPDFPLVQSFNFTKENGDLDADEMLKSLQRLDDPLREAESLYRSSPISLAMFSTLAGRGTLESLCYLASDPKMPIRCCYGTPDEHDRAKRSLANAKCVVVDPSALATLYWTNAYKQIQFTKGVLKITFATIQDYKRLFRDPDSRLYSKRTLGTRNDRIFLQEHSDEQIAGERQRLEEFLSWVKANCEMIGGKGVLQIPAENRGELTQLFGDGMVESVGAAIELDAVLWSDDFAITEFIADIVSVRRVWTSAVLDHLGEVDQISANDRMELLLQLIDFGYRFIRLDTETILYAARESRWDVDDRLFGAAINWLHTSGVTASGAVNAASFLIHSTWKNAPLAESRSQIALHAAQSLRKRNDGGDSLRGLARVLSASSEFSDGGKSECEKIIAAQLDLLEGRKRIVLPQDRDYRSK